MIHFLLVDDDIDDRELFTEALTEVTSPVSCTVCEDARNAIEKLDAEEIPIPDIIFLDINLPVVSGWECLAWLKKNHLYRDVPVIMYSTSSHDRDKEIAKDLGALLFFTKPNGYTQLVDFLKDIADNLSRNDVTAIAGYTAHG